MTSPFFNEDHESIREMARDFANKTLAPIAAEIDKTDAFPPEVAQQMADLGFFGLKIPEEYGGLGLDMRSYVSVMEEIAKKCATATLFISSANSLSTAPIVISGTDEQKAKYLPGVAAGEEYIAFGLTEPNAGSDAASMTTKAVEDGDCVLLEDLGNLLSNEIWSPAGAGEGAETAILAGIDAILDRAAVLVVVSNELFSDGTEWTGDMDRYVRGLGRLHQALAQRAETVAEVVCGIPVYHKGGER